MHAYYWFEKILDKLELRYGKLAIKNLISYIVGLNAFVYLLNYIKPDYIKLLTLNMDKVLEGQVWRLFTYLFIPPATDIIFIFFALYLLYLFGRALEAHWGSFRVNIYYLIGMVSTTIIGICSPQGPVTNVFINTSLFLAFAAVYPEFKLYLFFILPVKVKYLALITWIGIFLTVLFGYWVLKLLALVSVLNFLLFFWPRIIQNLALMRRGDKPLPAFSVSSDEPFHKCSICGKTEKDSDNLEFRVCTECNKEYCLEHLDHHEH